MPPFLLTRMKKFLSLLLLFGILSFSFAFSSCEEQPKKEKFSAYSFDYFDTVATIIGYEENRQKFDEIANEIFALLGEYHRLYTIYHRYEGLENLCTINELVNGEHRTVTVDRRIIDMLLYAKEMYTITNGKVNVAMGSVLSIWHDYRDMGTSDPQAAVLPPIEKLQEASYHTNIENLIINEEACTVLLKDNKMRLDVGAIAKGYAVEMVAQWLEARGITGYVLNIGGNVRTIGTKADGTAWTVGIDNPDGTDDAPYYAYLALADQSVVTSGSYQRYYVVNGKAYHHIIDPATLMPAERYVSISIVSNNSAEGDALSTALFCMSPEEGLALVNEYFPHVGVLWVMSDGTRQETSNFKNFEK